MKTKIFGMLSMLVIVIAMLASCFGGGGDNGSGNGSGNGGGDGGVAGAPTYSYKWADNTVIKMELTDNTNSDELGSGCRRYYAGAQANNQKEIDNLVRARNLAAQKATGTKVEYSYVGNTKEYAWGANVNRISQNAIVANSANPDIYCNFAYDMTSAQVRGAFANLKSQEYANGNWFRFNDKDYDPVSDNYFDSAAGEGYFYDYMESLTLTDDKMYCLASNYCTDLVRAFLVVPVNIKMLNAIAPEKSWTKKMTDYNDFYDLVWREGAGYEEGFTYDVVAHYSQQVYKDTNTNNNEKFGDILGFAAGSNSGLVSSGFLYTSNVTIIDKATLKYPEKNPALDVFGKSIDKLFRENETKGVIAVKSTDITGYDSNAKTELQAIRNKFASDGILFGGIIAVGSLEDAVYQKMRTEGEGFGVLPVPLYRSHVDDAKTQPQEYLTLVHNLARIVAIAKATTEFSQCSAYLDYVSRTSADILDSYYKDELGGATGGTAKEQNKKMLTYIRNHVRDCFDKTFEDSISNLNSNSGSSDAVNTSNWHYLLGNVNGYQYPSFATDWEAKYKAKQDLLDAIIVQWKNIK